MRRDSAHSILILLCAILLPLLPAAAGCSHSPESNVRPGVVSTGLRAILDTLKSDDAVIPVVVILHDTTGLTGNFPGLHIISKQVATGSFTRKEIDALSRRPQVERIDKSRTYKPLRTL